MIKYYFRTIKDKEGALKQVDKPRTGVWAHAEEPTVEEWQDLVSKFAIDEDILEDARDFFESPRVEKIENNTYFFTRYPYSDQKEGAGTAPLLIVMGASSVLTVALRPVPPLQKLFNGKETVITTQKTKLFIQIMSALTNSYDTELTRLRKGVHKDQAQLRKIGPREIERLVRYETGLNSMVDALIPTNTWLQQITNSSFLRLYEDDLSLMQDLVVDNNQVVNQARSILKTIQNVRSATEAIMSSRLNNSLSILTGFTILLTVPMVIASLYGMNVDLPLEDNPYTFIYILIFNTAILFGLLYFFRKKQWF